ncbi:hypothetical protein MRB53_038822 [Persea americana]|nr:hypothetical protein MRB53_038822 [Persea americana]
MVEINRMIDLDVDGRRMKTSDLSIIYLLARLIVQSMGRSATSTVVRSSSDLVNQTHVSGARRSCHAARYDALRVVEVVDTMNLESW